MSALSDALAKFTVAIDAAVVRVAALEAQAAEAPTLADLAAINDGTAKAEALAPEAASQVPPVEHPAS